MAGGDTIVKIIPGGAHGYLMASQLITYDIRSKANEGVQFPRDADETAEEGMKTVEAYVLRQLG